MLQNINKPITELNPPFRGGRTNYHKSLKYSLNAYDGGKITNK